MPGLREGVPGRPAGKLAVLQKETENKIRVIDNMFKKELQERYSNIADVKDCLRTEVDDAMYELIGYIQSAKIELDY